MAIYDAYSYNIRGGSRTSSKGGARVNNRTQSVHEKFDHIAANETNSQKSQLLTPTNRNFEVKFMSDQVFLA